jgi:hypothetical protein
MMNVSYYRGQPASVWRAAFNRRRPAATTATTTTTGPTTTTTTGPIDVSVVVEGLARAA